MGLSLSKLYSIFKIMPLTAAPYKKFWLPNVA